MIYLSAENLSKQFTEKILFEDLKFSINKGDKVGLVAHNGAGKSTLLKILTGKEEPNSGGVYLNKDIRLGYLDQNPLMKEEQTLNDFIQETVSNEAVESASTNSEPFDAWDYERRVKQLLDRFKVVDLDRKIGSLSGGEKKRFSLAITLLDKPELLILDEPTNHLDIEMIEWLEKYLSHSSITLLMVTHDRYFLDRVCNHIFELEDGKIYHHSGNYGFYLEKKEERELNTTVEVEKARQKVKKELEWIRRSPKARTTKSKSRVDAFYELKKKASISLIKSELQLEVTSNRLGGKIIELEEVNKAYGDKVLLNSFTYVFRKGERIGIVGPNGVGKSTFLNLLTGVDTPDSGNVTVGDNTVFGYYQQGELKIEGSKMIIDVIKEVAEVITLANGKTLSASQFLTFFLFPPPMQRTPYELLSGGEKKRLQLLLVLIKNPNFLILDEPTNDLDLQTLQKLEEFLENYSGCLILVSHDRYFMDKLAGNLFIFEGEGIIRGYIGSYSEYRALQKDVEMAGNEKPKAKPKKPNPEKPKQKLTYKEKLEYESLEMEIEKLEQEKQELEDWLNSGSNDFKKLEETSRRVGEIIDVLDEKMMRWMELDEFAS